MTTETKIATIAKYSTTANTAIFIHFINTFRGCDNVKSCDVPASTPGYDNHRMQKTVSIHRQNNTNNTACYCDDN